MRRRPRRLPIRKRCRKLSSPAKSRSGRPAPAQPAAQPVQSAATSANGSANGPPLQQVPQAGKTGTPIGDLPQSVVEVPRALVAEQGGTSLRDAIYTDRAETGMEGGDAGPFDASASRASQFAGKDNESDLLKRTSPCTSARSKRYPGNPSLDWSRAAGAAPAPARKRSIALCVRVGARRASDGSRLLPHDRTGRHRGGSRHQSACYCIQNASRFIAGSRYSVRASSRTSFDTPIRPPGLSIHNGVVLHPAYYATRKRDLPETGPLSDMKPKYIYSSVEIVAPLSLRWIMRPPASASQNRTHGAEKSG